MIKKIFLILYFLFPICIMIVVFYISFSFKELAKTRLSPLELLGLLLLLFGQ